MFRDRRGYVPAMSATEVIQEIERLPANERQEVFEWMKSRSRIDWRRIDGLMAGAPKYTEEEILNFPRVRPAGY